MSDPLLLTVEESAKKARISRAKVYQLLKAREIESVKIGRSRRIPADALSDYIARLRAAQGKAVA